MEDNFSSSLKKENIDLWNKILSHPLVDELGKFELPKEKFETFIKQDYRYLIGFIRCLGIFLSKSKEKQDIMEFKDLVEVNIEEIEALEAIYEGLGNSKSELGSSEASLITKSYKSFLLSQAYEGSKFETYGVILPCDWIFAEIGKKLEKVMPEPSKDHHKIYQNWIKTYASKKYQKDIVELRERIDKNVEKVCEKEKKTFRKNFETGLKYESSFFNQVYFKSQD